MTETNFRALCEQLMELVEGKRYDGSAVVAEARTALAQPKPVAPTDEESDAFAIVQMRLDDLAGDQELMIYRWPDGEWSIDHTNPTSSVQLGEVNGVYGSTGRILEDVVFALAAQLSANNTGGTH
jgi:hypothetical protein